MPGAGALRRAGGDAPGSWAARLAAWLKTGEGRAVAVLVVVPLVLFVVPAFFGHPAISGDNAIQNFPLRVFTGRLLRSGHLPLWNPYIWSGSPLLGGLNAGSAYPFTILFALFAPVAAWVINLLVVYWAAGLGVYVLLRQYGVRPLAALLAGLTYALSGTLASQLVHLGIVQGMAWAPWLVLALVRLSWSVLATGPRGEEGEGPRTGSPWPWVTLLASVLGLIALTGEPRSMAEAEVVAPIVLLWLVFDPRPGWAGAWRRRAALLGYSALGALWGAALAAIQVIPGWSFINASQRSAESYQYFGAGSLRPAWSALLLVPDLFGGTGLFGEPHYFNNYNLPEVTGYVGLVPLLAAVALLLRCLGRRRDQRAGDWGMFLVLGGVGLLATWGSFTPLGHLFVHIPLFGKTRLQSRNLGIVDLALAVLLGMWADRALRARPADAGLSGWRRWAALVPVACAGALLVVALADPVPLEEAFETTSTGAVLGRAMSPWFWGQLAVVAAIVALVVAWRRLSPLARKRLLTSVVLLDVGFFMVSSASGFSNGHAPVEPTAKLAHAVIGSTGRFAIYDLGGPTSTLNLVGQPDLNALAALPSVVGYGSILANTYGQATGTHTLDTLNTCALADGVFTQLRLATILTRSNFLTRGVLADGAAPAPPPTCRGEPLPGTRSRRTFYFGQRLDVTTVELASVASHRGVPLRLGALGAQGQVSFPAETVRPDATGWTVTFLHPAPSYGLVVSGPAREVTDNSVVTATDGRRIALDGILQHAISTTVWRMDGTWRSSVRFRARHVLPPVWAAHGAPASVHQVSTGSDGGAVVAVSSRQPVTVVRSAAYLAGWKVTATPVGGGRARSLPVVRVGLVQGVHVPAGRWTLTYGYRPKGLLIAVALSALGFAALLVAAVLAVVGRRRRVTMPRVLGEQEVPVSVSP